MTIRMVAVCGAVAFLVVACGGQQPAPPAPTPVPAVAEPTAEPEPAAEPVPEAPAPTEVPAAPTPAGLTLRSRGTALTPAQVTDMFAKRGFSHGYDASGAGLPGVVEGSLTHRYEGRASGGVGVVVDHATGLMWQKTGSYEHSTSGLVKAADVQSYVAGLNGGKHAGFGDWRLPTLEELASLIEPEKHQGSEHLNPAFEPGALWFALTTDTVTGDPSMVWTVDFGAGMVAEYSATDEYYILLVRSAR